MLLYAYTQGAADDDSEEGDLECPRYPYVLFEFLS